MAILICTGNRQAGMLSLYTPQVSEAATALPWGGGGKAAAASEGSKSLRRPEWP